jgi:DNA-binding XRE family transcriptional regulator
MNAFDQLVIRLRKRLGGSKDVHVSVEEPISPAGIHFLTIARDGYAIEVEWQRHRGFGIAAGRELMFGSGVDEVYGSAESAFERILGLLKTSEATSTEAAVNLIDLRKLRGLLQKDVADSLGISKSGLAQMERPDALTAMQIDTLRKLVASMGGQLVLSARFPEGHERKIAVD